MEFKLDIHTHTVASGHAYSTLEENIRIAGEKGLELMAFTDHAPSMPGSTHIFHFYTLRLLPPVIDGVRVLKGAEANIMDHEGSIDLDDEVLEVLEFVIASLHPPCYAYSTEKNHTNAIIKAMDNPGVNVIGHPGDVRYNFDIPAVVSASKATGTLLEINNSSLQPNSFRPGGDIMIRKIIQECLKQNVPLVMGSDAHFSRDVGNFNKASEILGKLDFPEEMILNTSTDKFLKHIGLSRE